MNTCLKICLLSFTVLAVSSCDTKSLLGPSSSLPPALGSRISEVNPPLPLDFSKADYTFEEGGRGLWAANGLPTRIYVSMPPRDSDQWKVGFEALRRYYSAAYGFQKEGVAFDVFKHCRGVRLSMTGLRGGAQEDVDVDKLEVGHQIELKSDGWTAKAVVEEVDTIPDPAPDAYASRTISHMWVKIWVGQTKPAPAKPVLRTAGSLKAASPKPATTIPAASAAS